ncbi:MAG: hypothetical protein ABI599_16125 [Flavobacteriales bacterium]
MPLLKPDLRAALHRSMGADLGMFEHALEQPPPVSIRLNASKPTGDQGEPVPWCATGRYLTERPVFTLDPCFHAGAYYVQESSSMILEPVFKATGLSGKRMVALDLCAAPGGKSTHLRSLMSDDSLLVCNEVEPKRAHVLQENLWKWGHPNVVVCNAQPDRFTHLQEAFDLILVDAPCSGEGLIRKDAYAMEQWTPALVRECELRQQRIIDTIWPTLRPGGFLIYSTCTYEACENEEQIERILSDHDAEHVAISGLEELGPVRGKNGIGLRCLPHLVRGEGQFMALLRKEGEWNERTAVNATHAPKPVDDPVLPLLVRPDELDFRLRREVWFAAPASHSAFIDRLVHATDPIAPGVPVAEGKAKQWRPHPALALSRLLDTSSVPVIPLNTQDALRYLRGEALRASQATGFALMTLSGLAAGWAKGAGNRWNNHWPDPWRIRMR